MSDKMMDRLIAAGDQVKRERRLQSLSHPHGYKPAWYESPIDLPEKRFGTMQIKHRIINGKEPVISMRQAWSRGVLPVTALVQNLRVHQLVEGKDKLWMTDRPEELNQIYESLFAFRPFGRVLVGGLGLGILAKLVARVPAVQEVVAVEINEDVISLCYDARGGYSVLRADVKDYLREHKKPFDCYMLDTWQGTNELAWWMYVFPLRRIIRNRFGMVPRLQCWAEDIMWGQIRGALMQRCGSWYYEKLSNMSGRQAQWFLENVGTTSWEQKYGRLVPTL